MSQGPPRHRKRAQRAERERDTVGFEALARWIVGEFCRTMQMRAGARRTRRLQELSARGRELIRTRESKEKNDGVKT